MWPHERRDPREDHFHGVRRGPRGDRLGGASCGGSHTQGARRPAGLAQADRLGELRLAGRAADHGHLVQRQVRRGHRRSPVLRGLPERRHGRVAGRRARTRAVRCAVRLCAAALRHRRQPRRLLVDPGQPRGDPDAGAAGRQERQRALRGRLGDAAPRVRQPAAARHVPGCRWTPHPRVPARTSAARCSTSSSTAPTPRPACSTTTQWPRRPGSSSRSCSSPATPPTRAG